MPPSGNSKPVRCLMEKQCQLSEACREREQNHGSSRLGLTPRAAEVRGTVRPVTVAVLPPHSPLAARCGFLFCLKYDRFNGDRESEEEEKTVVLGATVRPRARPDDGGCSPNHRSRNFGERARGDGSTCREHMEFGAKLVTKVLALASFRV
ncbi:hypothetical protein MTO96_018499 [Rhipicephalus appendiculatus]